MVIIPVPRHAEHGANGKTIRRLGLGLDAAEDEIEDAIDAAEHGDGGRQQDRRDLFVFRGRGGELIKIIWHDGFKRLPCLSARILEPGELFALQLFNPVLPLTQ